MATQSGLTLASVDAPFVLAHDIKKPKPGPKEVLVKSLAVGLNPMESLMQHTGLLVVTWPAVIGTDASGVIVEVGEEVQRLKPGDHVLGCTRLGLAGYGPFQDYFLMDDDTTVKYGSNITTDQAPTVGVGLYTAALALLAGTDLELPAAGKKAEEKDEWIIVIGASGSVGQFAVQIGHLCGYKVLGSCSPSKKHIPISNGATATLNHRLSLDEQLAEIKQITGGNFARVFDSSTQGVDLAIKALETISTTPKKWFSTVDDWSEMNTPKSITEYRTRLGLIGRLDNHLGRQTTEGIASWIPLFEAHLNSGALKPLSYDLVPGKGWEALVEGMKLLDSGKAPQKLVVQVQDE